MKQASLVIGYDADDLPQKVCWSFDNGKKRAEFRILFENGNLFIAQSSTVALKADGGSWISGPIMHNKTWYLDGGGLSIEEKQGDRLPDFPLNLKIWKKRQPLCRGAARRSGGRRDLSH